MIQFLGTGTASHLKRVITKASTTTATSLFRNKNQRLLNLTRCAALSTQSFDIDNDVHIQSR